MNQPFILIQKSANICIFEVVGLNAHSQFNFQWEFGDGANSDKDKPTHTYTSQGDFSVGVVVKEVSLDGVKAQYRFTQKVRIEHNTPTEEGTGSRDVGGVHTKQARPTN